MAYSDKDSQAIVSQVCAKIACDLTDKTLPVDERVGEFTALFESVRSIVFDAIFNIDTTAQPSPLKLVTEAFPGSTVEQGESVGSLTIKGKQHGPLPQWIIDDAREAGVTEVWDNRDQLKEFPKRPPFKEVRSDNKGKGFWPPKTT